MEDLVAFTAHSRNRRVEPDALREIEMVRESVEVLDVFSAVPVVALLTFRRSERRIGHEVIGYREVHAVIANARLEDSSDAGLLLEDDHLVAFFEQLFGGDQTRYSCTDHRNLLHRGPPSSDEGSIAAPRPPPSCLPVLPTCKEASRSARGGGRR